jgi:hypothetical protein
MNLRGHWTTFVLDLEDELGAEFAMMAGMGLFVRCGHTWRMIIPPVLTQETLRRAVLAYTRTEDEEYVLHPEQLVACMSLGEATVLQKQIELFHGSRDEQPHRLR